MTKGSIHQENIVIINMYVPNTRAPKYMNHTLNERRNRLLYNNNRRIQYFPFNSGQNIQTDQWGKRGLEKH